MQLYKDYVSVFPNCLVTLRKTSRQNAGFRKIIKVSFCLLFLIIAYVMLCIVLFVLLSGVCLSVTRQYCVEMAGPRMMWLPRQHTRRTLVFS